MNNSIKNIPTQDNKRKEIGKVTRKDRYSDFKAITPDVLVALRDGDHRAFDLIYNKCIEPMRAFFRLILQNDSDTEDLCQELFVKLWEQRDRVNPDSNFRSYLYTIAKTSSFMLLRRRNVENKFVNFKLNEDPDHEHSPDSDLISNEISLMIQLAMSNMPPVRRQVFEMSRMEGLTHEEIAKKLNISSGNVRNHLYRAMKDIKELMAFTLFFLIQ